MFGLDDIVSTGLKILDKVIPDPVAKEKAKAELLALQQKGELKLEEFDVKREEIAAGDRDSARDMQEAALGQDDLLAKRFIYYYAVFWSLFSALYIACITFVEIPADNKRFADTILGFLLGTAIASMFQYFFGSSAGSKQKTNLMGRK